MTNTIQIQVTTLPTEVWTNVLSQLEVTDLCLVSRLNIFFYDLANQNLLWKPAHKVLIETRIAPQRQWWYLGQKYKKESYRKIVSNCPETGNALIQAINNFFLFLKKNEKNEFRGSFSDGVEMDIVIRPKVGNASKIQIQYCDCLFPFFAFTCAAEQHIPVYEKRSHPPHWRWQKISALGGRASCTLIFPQETKVQATDPTTVDFCQQLQEKMLRVITPRLNKL
jgi:hypothetical protein